MARLPEGIELIIAHVLETADASFDARAVEPPLLELRSILESSGARRPEYLDAILALTGPDELRLAKPGVVEILEFCMRQLRWPEVREAMLAIESTARNWHVRRTAQRVLEVYEDEWPGGEIYDTYREQ